jgi:hypothetical protein
MTTTVPPAPREISPPADGSSDVHAGQPTALEQPVGCFSHRQGPRRPWRRWCAAQVGHLRVFRRERCQQPQQCRGAIRAAGRQGIGARP